MKKVLIQVVSVITLVFGTCYQSVLALADDRSRTELSGVQLNDSEGNKTQQVKVSEKNELEMTVTVNNKDGENKDGEAAMWLPEDQLKVIKNRVKAESAVTDTNATLIFERKNKQQKLEWKNVETTATFKLKLPVQFKTPMTNMALPIALGTQREYLDPMTVLSKDATEKEVQDAGQATQLPANLLQSLTSFIDAQKAQETQQAEAPAKDDNEDKDAAKEDAAEEETEAERDAEKKAEQEAEDRERKEAETKEVLEKNTRAANAESNKDAAEREDNDKEDEEGTNLGNILKNNPGNKPLDKSIFNSVTLEQTGKEPVSLTDDNADVTDLQDFELVYKWDSKTLLEKLNPQEIKKNDYYTFKIFGSEFKGEKGKDDNGEIKTPDGDVYAKWTLEEVSATSDEQAHQKVTIKFVNEMLNNTNVNFDMRISQTYTGPYPVKFEFNDNASIEVDPIKTEDLLKKDGQFNGNNEIKWTVTLDTSSEVDGETMKYSDIKLIDRLLLGDKNQTHSFADWKDWDVRGSDIEESLKENFKLDGSGNSRTISGISNDEVETDELTFTIITKYDEDKFGTFANEVSGLIGDGINLKAQEAKVSSSSLSKKYEKYDKDAGFYLWSADVRLNLDEFADDAAKRAALKSLKLTDTLQGPHVFTNETDLGLGIQVDGEDIKGYFTPKFTNTNSSGESKELELQLKTNITDDELDTLIGFFAKDENNKNGKTMTISYRTKESGSGGINQVNNTMELDWNGGHRETNKVPSTQTGQLVKKSGELLREPVYEDGKAHVKWTLNVNASQRKFDTLRVIDVLPDNVNMDSIESITIGDVTFKISDIRDNGTVRGIRGLRIVKGYADPKATDDDSLYNFARNQGNQEANRTNHALQFRFNANFSGQAISIKMETTHDWKNGDPTNYAGALIDNRLYEYSNDTATIDDRIRNDAFKDGEVQLTENKLEEAEKNENTVLWSIGIGSRLNNYFGAGDGQINTITIDEKLNGDGAKYLSLLEDTSQYELYSVSPDGYIKGQEETKKTKINTTEKDPDATIQVKRKTGTTDEGTITINFIDKENAEKYSFLKLEFKAPIDFKAWEKFSKDNDVAEVPSNYQFLNDATILYDDDNDNKHQVHGETNLAAKGIYGQKTAKDVTNNRIQWQAILNASSMDIGQPVITDTLSGDHIHGLAPDDIDISLVDVNRERNGDGYRAVVANPANAEKLKYNEDYEIKQEANKFTITFKRDIDRPILLEYKTTVIKLGAAYGNNIKITSDGYDDSYVYNHNIKAGAFADSWGTRFLKMDADKDKPLPGAKFKLQWSPKGKNDWSDAVDIKNNPIPTMTSNDEGFIQFTLLGDLREYRIVEVDTPDDSQNSQLAEFIFDKDRFVKEDWQHNIPTINNHDVDPANLTIRKDVEKMDSSTEFEFEVRALDESDEVDTSFNGKYKLDRSGEEVEFINGVSRPIKVEAGQSKTILGLPYQMVPSQGEGSDEYPDPEDYQKRNYEVSEIGNKDGFATEVSVHGEKLQPGYTTRPFELNPNTASTVTARFLNTADKGDMEVRKTVSGGSEADKGRKYTFTIEATNKMSKDAVKDKRFETDGALSVIEFNGEGKVSFELSDSQYVYIRDLPAATSFKVTEEKLNLPNLETTWSINGNDYGTEEKPVTIDPKLSQHMSFKNSFEDTGQINLAKKIAGSVSANEQFKFKIKTDKDVAGKYPYAKYNTLTGAVVSSGEIEFKEGETSSSEISLKGNENVIISKLPLNTDFTITETETGDSHIETSWATEEGDGDGRNTSPISLETSNDMHNVTFTNALPHGSLTLSKKVLNQLPGDDSTRFIFDIKVKGQDIDKVLGKTFEVKGNNGMRGIKFDKNENGDASANLRLSHDQSIEILGLPAGIDLHISERGHSDFNVSYRVDGGEDKDDADGPTVTIPDGKDTSVEYTNTRPDYGRLVLQKQAKGAYPINEDIEFTINALGENDALTRDFDATLRETNGSNVPLKVKFKDGSAKVSIKPGERLQINNLVTGKYQVTENLQKDSVTTTWEITGDQGTGEKAAPVEVKEDGIANVSFVNNIPVGSLMLEKRAEGSYPTGDQIGFTITKVNDGGFNGEFDGTLTKTSGTTAEQKIEFTNGRARVHIFPGESLQINGLPLEDFRVREDRQENTVSTTWYADGENDIGLTTDDITIKENHTANVLFVNKIATGELVLNKSVASHENADKDKDYKFDIQASRETRRLVAGKSYVVKNHQETQQIEFNRNGHAEITVKGDHTITISGLPDGVRLTVIETDSNGLKATWNVNNNGGYRDLTRRNQPRVTITEGQTEVVSYRNVRDPVGSLRVDKVVKGAYTDDDHKFTFKVDAQMPDSENDDEWIINPDFNNENEYDVKIYSRSNNELQESSKVKFVEGQATLKLKADQYAVIEGLPLNKNERFQVSEEDPEITNMTTTWAKDNGTPETGLVAESVTLNETNVPRVTFTNSLETGNLVLNKKLSGEITDTDRDKTFEFTVDVQTEDTDNPGEWKTDETFAGTHIATKTDADGHPTTSNVTFVDGQLKVHLKGGEQLRIGNLPTDTRVVISEAVDGDYETSYQIDHNSVTQGTTTDQIIIPNGSDVGVSFINNRPVVPQTAWLGLTKSVLGETGERDREFEFNIRFLDDQMNPLTQTIAYTKTSAIGGLEPGQLMLEADGSNTFTLMDGETIRWNVPNGTHYQITESDYSADGYQTSLSQGQAPEREGLTATGVVMTNDPGSAKVVYYNRAITPPEEEPHTPEEPDTSDPSFVPPASESGTGIGTSTDGSIAGSGTQGTGGSTAPQAHTSGTSGSGTAAKGFLPQTGEWMKQNWLLLLGFVILLSTIGLVVRAKRKKS